MAEKLYLPKLPFVKMAKSEAGITYLNCYAVEKFRIESENYIIAKWKEVAEYAKKSHPDTITIRPEDVAAVFSPQDKTA